jgi:hypothetical protein
MPSGSILAVLFPRFKSDTILCPREDTMISYRDRSSDRFFLVNRPPPATLDYYTLLTDRVRLNQRSPNFYDHETLRKMVYVSWNPDARNSNLTSIFQLFIEKPTKMFKR